MIRNPLTRLKRAYTTAKHRYQKSGHAADRLKLTRALLAYLRAGGCATFEREQERRSA